MKKIINPLFAIVLLVACNSQNGDKKSETPAKHNEHKTNLVLNNGAKWKADSATKSNITYLQTVIAIAKKMKPEDYQQLANPLEGGLNKMVAECKMQGPDHDALHHWLEPLIEKIKSLKTETNVEKAGEIFGEIKEHLNLFSQYFE